MRPEAIEPGTDLSGGSDTISDGHDSYEYRCYDESGELKNRIRAYIVEWDSNEALSTYISSAGASGSPEGTGIDGTNCDASSSLPDSNCDDFVDWSSLMTGFPQETEAK